MSETEKLRLEVAKLTEEKKQLEDKAAQLEEENDRLQHQVKLLSKMKFGQKSEKTEYIMDGQLDMFNEAEKEEDKKARANEKPIVVKEHERKQKRTREELTKDLPVKEEIISLPPEERKCGKCFREMLLVGKEFIRDELVYVPAEVYVRKIYAEVYKCPVCGKDEEQDAKGKDIAKSVFKKAVAPSAMIPKSFCTPELLAHILYEKYGKAVPLYRQEKDFAAKGICLSRTTMANWIVYAAENFFKPIYEEMKKDLLTKRVIHADETVVQVLKEPGRKAKDESRMWVYCSGEPNENIVLFEYQPTRNGDHAKRFLGNYSGYLVTDGCASYNKLTSVTRCGCWAHVRRKFVDALPKEGAEDSAAAKGIKYIDDLFTIERVNKGVSEKEKARKEQSAKIVSEFYEWLGTFNASGAGLKNAVGFALSQKKLLIEFLNDPVIPISNNRAENAIRPFVVGRKNWLFSDTPAGAKASAIIYSLVETAKADDKNVEQYFTDLLKNVNR